MHVIWAVTGVVLLLCNVLVSAGVGGLLLIQIVQVQEWMLATNLQPQINITIRKNPNQFGFVHRHDLVSIFGKNAARLA